MNKISDFTYNLRALANDLDRVNETATSENFAQMLDTVLVKHSMQALDDLTQG